MSFNSRSTILGHVIRIDVDARRYRYKIPSDNPFVGIPGVRAEIYAYATRKMWRCSVDRGDRKTGEGKGRIVCGDVGIVSVSVCMEEIYIFEECCIHGQFLYGQESERVKPRRK